MLPQELKSMSIDSEIIIFEGMSSPVLCEKIKYYEDSNFITRLLPAVEIPNLIF